ncbi:hypothetical protein QJS83_16065 [Bdellovibrio sp. 22V]|uniref:hypothetical protein n=1 Tax=Bdellovibrio TaxID=958 RepID=UPI0025427923|nr:hypothetical protein [Bdellovibrio sp. 22V]WII71979.1 hypothetical protein QJS83_16065 [Bdellovibrio sp. 22V]
MKAIVLTLATLVMSSSAFAVHAGSSWRQIFADRDAVVTHGYNINNIPLDNACMSDDEIRAIEPTRECMELVPVKVDQSNGEGGGPYYDWVCARYETIQKTAPRTYEAPECLKLVGNGEQSHECVEFGTREVTVPRTIETQVWINRGEAGTSFWKDFTFPECHDVQPH